MQVARLLTIVRVDEEHKLRCQVPGCGHGIYAAVHVIRDETGAVRVIGQDCYATLTGHRKATEQGPSFGGWGGRKLTAAERDAMLADTAAFVARMEAEWRAREEVLRKAEEERRAEEQRAAEDRRKEAERAFKAAGPGTCRDGGNWRQPLGVSSGTDPLSRWRAQQAMNAARVAMARNPGLGSLASVR